MSQYYTLNKLSDAAKKYGYKLAECYDQHGVKACKSHAANVKPEKWINTTLKTFLDNPTTPDGVYQVHMHQDSNKRLKSDVFYILKGKAPAEGFTPSTVIVQSQAKEQKVNPKDNPLSWESALDYQNQIKNLELKVKALEIENTSLQKKLDEIKEEHEEMLAEGEQTDTVNNFFKNLRPALDTWFQDRREQRGIAFLQAAAQNPQLMQYQELFLPQGNRQPQAQNQAQQTQLSEDQKQEMAKVNQFFADHQLCSDKEDAIAQKIKAKSPNYDKFLENLSIEAPELFNKLLKYVHPNE